MKLLFLILALSNVFLMQSYAQSRHLDDLSSKNINKLDSLERLQGLWVHYCCNAHGIVSYRKHHIGYYINDRKDGLWQTFKDDQLEGGAYFKKGRINGDVFIYNQKKVFIHLKMISDKLDGDCRVFSKKGKLIAFYVYEKDILKEYLCFRHKNCDKNHFDLKKMIPYFH